MNYVIINGVKSTTIQGLLIQFLPPISKPLLRTSTEEIDGRDGDIVTPLGYSAYDKQMEIGLFGNYDVDEVISYFDTEGTIIFSNEPDKFYNFQMIEQIDFERLVKFRTATVTFHVQPFKFSAVDDAFTVAKNQLIIRPYSYTMNGITVSVVNGVISLSGTAELTTDFYIPIVPMTLSDKQYTLNGTATGTIANNVRMRVIGESPSDADSFGGQYVNLSSSISLTDTPASEKTYHYVYFNIPTNANLNCVLTMEMLDDTLNSFKAFNRGNCVSRPTLTVHGSGTIKLSINGVERFTLTMGGIESITLDGLDMNAYHGETLMNRSVSGNYNDLQLKVGTNTLSWVGDVSRVDVEKVSRWI